MIIDLLMGRLQKRVKMYQLIDTFHNIVVKDFPVVNNIKTYPNSSTQSEFSLEVRNYQNSSQVCVGTNRKYWSKVTRQ